MEITYQVEKLYNTDSTDPDREDRHRVVDLPSGNKAHLRARDPYGFVYINLDRGATPAVLAGAYTSFTEAQRAVQNFINEKAKDVELALEAQKRTAKHTTQKLKLTPRIETNDSRTDAS